MINRVKKLSSFHIGRHFGFGHFFFQFSKNLFLKSYNTTNFLRGMPKLNRNCGHCDTTILGSCQRRFHEIFPNLSTLEL